VTTTIAAPVNGDNRSDYEILVKGNTLAAQWARRILGRRKLGKFLSVLLNPQRSTETLGIPQEKVEAIFAIPSKDRDAILATQGVVNRIFNKFDRLALSVARKFAAAIGRDNDADVTQLESEARVGLLKAIRGYTRLQIKFITYAHKSCFNEVSRYVQRKMGISLCGVNASLLVRYKRKMEELYKASLPHSFEDVCRELGLKNGQIIRLRDALNAQVTSESELEDNLSSLLLASNRSAFVDAELIKKFNNIAIGKMEMCAFFAQSADVRALFPQFHCNCCECEKRRNTEPDFKMTFDSLKDVAAHFGVTPQAASEALKRARVKYAAALGREWNPNA